LQILVAFHTNVPFQEALTYVSEVLRDILLGFGLPIFPDQLALLFVDNLLRRRLRVRVLVLRHVGDRLGQADLRGVHLFGWNDELDIFYITEAPLFIELELR